MGFIADNFWRDAPAKAAPSEVTVVVIEGIWYACCRSLPAAARVIEAHGWISYPPGSDRIPWPSREGAERCAAIIREALANG